MKSIVIAARFRGPPSSANGGYFAGSLAALASQTVTVRLLKPPPLDVPMAVEEADGGLRVRVDATAIGEAFPATLALQPARSPRYFEAVEASRGYAGGFGGYNGNRYSGAGAIAATSALGPVFGPGFAQRMSPRRLAAALAALDSVMVMRS